MLELLCHSYPDSNRERNLQGSETEAEHLQSYTTDPSLRSG